jgi:hypothetical protein
VIFHYPATYHIFNDTGYTAKRYHPERDVWRSERNWSKDIRGNIDLLCSRSLTWQYYAITSVVCQAPSQRLLEPAWRAAGNNVADRFYVYERLNNLRREIGEKQFLMKRTTVMPAIQLAIRLGAARIYLLGFDCCQRAGFRYFYEPGCPPMPGGATSRQAQLQDSVDDMDTLREVLFNRKIFDTHKIFNLSPISQCRAWNRLDWGIGYGE